MKKCGYLDQDDVIRDAIVYGIQDDKVREKCIGEGSNLTLEKAINFARTSYISMQQIQSMEDKSALGISKGRTIPSQQRLNVKMKVRNR